MYVLNMRRIEREDILDIFNDMGTKLDEWLIDGRIRRALWGRDEEYAFTRLADAVIDVQHAGAKIDQSNWDKAAHTFERQSLFTDSH
jgi:hypothetical protein